VKVTAEKAEHSQVVLNVEMEPTEVEKSLEEAYRHLVLKANIPGFRKGKAPRSVLERHLGKGALLEHALEHLVPEACHKAIDEQKVEAIAEEIIVVGGLQHSLEHALMPANDYLITGKRKYIDDFNMLSREVEERLKRSEELLDYLEVSGLSLTEKEGKSLNDIKTAWQNIREISLKVFYIPNPIGNKDGARIMEEMDYRWGEPATAMLQKWHEGDIEEYKEAIKLAEKSRRISWIIMVSAATLMLILGAGFTAFCQDPEAITATLRFGAAVGALAVTRKGAFAAMPSLDEVQQLLQAQDITA